MECPHCKKELKANISRAYRNMQSYSQYNGATSIVATECCNKAVVVTLVSDYEISAYNGDETTDDWGLPIK